MTIIVVSEDQDKIMETTKVYDLFSSSLHTFLLVSINLVLNVTTDSAKCYPNLTPSFIKAYHVLQMF